MSAMTVPWIKRLEAPDTTEVALLLIGEGLNAYVGSYTELDTATDTQVGAGATVFLTTAGPDARAYALDVLLEAGYVCSEHDGGTIGVALEPDRW